MANSNPMRFLRDNGSLSNDLALVVDQMGGMTINAFRERSIMRSLTKVIPYSKGVTYQFPATWKVTSNYHTPGQQLTGQQINDDFYPVSLESKFITADFSIHDIDPLIAQFDVQNEYAQQLGLSLANTFDKQLILDLIIASRQTANTPFPGGGYDGNGTAYVGADLDNTTASTRCEAFLTMLQDVGTRWRTIDVPVNQWVVIVEPHMFQQLVNHKVNGLYQLMNTDWVGTASGANLINPPEMLKWNNFLITWTNHGPFGHIRSGSYTNGQNYTTDTSDMPSKYKISCVDTVGVAFTPDAIGSIIASEPTLEAQRRTDYLDWVFVSKLLKGTGPIRPYCAIELKRS